VVSCCSAIRPIHRRGSIPASSLSKARNYPGCTSPVEGEIPAGAVPADAGIFPEQGESPVRGETKYGERRAQNAARREMMKFFSSGRGAAEKLAGPTGGGDGKLVAVEIGLEFCSLSAAPERYTRPRRVSARRLWRHKPMYRKTLPLCSRGRYQCPAVVFVFL